MKMRFHNSKYSCAPVLLFFFFLMQKNFVQCSVCNILWIHKLPTDNNARDSSRDQELQHIGVEKFYK